MLTTSILSNGLQGIFDQESSLFKGFPASRAEAASRWAAAFDDYAKSVIPPSTTSASARQIFQSTFMSLTDENGLTQLPLCFLNYAVTLATGMSPLYAGVPPVMPPVLTPCWAIGMGGGKSSQVISSLVSTIDAWMRTGKAIHSITGVTIPWS